MRRRDFIATGVTMASALGALAVFGQSGGLKTRAAVVIGVRKAGDLPVLNAAASGARTVASWLAGEGFEVKLFVDDGTPAKVVKAGEIFNAIDELVSRGTLDQLVVYFSGHGFLRSSNSEYWMLSEAPNNPNEAVNMTGSVTLARESAIPNVVFISDACRSPPGSLKVDRVIGSVIFPNKGVARRVRPEVDLFFAALPGESALELPETNSVTNFEGIYTACFLDAFKYPDDEMVKEVSGVRVVTNRGLKPYLARAVPKKANDKSIRLSQMPDTRIESGETTYIGRVAESALPSSPRDLDTKPSILDVAGRALWQLGVPLIDTVDETHGYHTACDECGELLWYTGSDIIKMGFADGLRAILGARGNVPTYPIKTGTGFAVSGSRVALAIGNPWMETTLITPGDEEAGQPLHSVPAIIQVEARKARAGSVAIQFADGSGTVIAAIDGYVGTVVVDRGGVTNVSYVHSQENGRWPDYERKRARLDQLRATVGTAARFGVFRIEGERETRTKRARQLGDAIRILNDIDATLGLYAAYAYADADLSDEVRSVRSLMHQTLNADLFDVAMLSGILSGKRSDDGDDPVPFCPMLSQGWNLLRVKDVRLLPEIEEARYHLRPALWTTFDPEGMRIILKALRSGRLR